MVSSSQKADVATALLTERPETGGADADSERSSAVAPSTSRPSSEPYHELVEGWQ
jgi:hypothetical protein